MKRILVTGGSGFIGSHTCCALLEDNYDLLVIDSLVNSSFKSIERIKKILLNLSQMENILNLKLKDLMT